MTEPLPTLDEYYNASPKQRHAIRMIWFLTWEAGDDEARKLYQNMIIGKGRVESERPTHYGEDQDMW